MNRTIGKRPLEDREQIAIELSRLGYDRMSNRATVVCSDEA